MAREPRISPPPAGGAASAGVVKLSPAECEVVARVARGFSNREIAHALSKSEGTVKNQLSSVYRKLGISRRTRLMMMFRP